MRSRLPVADGVIEYPRVVLFGCKIVSFHQLRSFPLRGPIQHRIRCSGTRLTAPSPMCGITGFIDRRLSFTLEERERTLRAMTDSLIHRGPDDSGLWFDHHAGAGMGHRRLSIVDLSPSGHQPMISACGRFVIAYNGEVYNFEEIRAELQALGRSFRGRSDTEVILEACAHWGIDRVLPRLIGMFAIALWDRDERLLFLARDRLGKKPLYWYSEGDVTMFASELKALRLHSGWSPQVDRDAVAAFMRHNYIPSPWSIYKNVHKLEPGTILRLDGRSAPQKSPYWDFGAVVEQALARRVRGADNEVVSALDELLQDAVSRRMVADVPIGALLSGGVDSSVVAALMQKASTRPVRTFSIGFGEAGYDEAPFAKAVARHLSTDHTELYVEPGDTLDVIPNLAEWYDEPFADSSQIPTYLVCRLTRAHVTVVLSGDGGDELFAGYNRYFYGSQIWSQANVAPQWMRRHASRFIKRVPVDRWDRVGSIVPARIRPPQFGHKLHKLADAIAIEDPDAVYRQMVSHWSDPNSLVLGASEPHGLLWDPGNRTRVPDFVERMQFVDTLTYLPDDILVKVDRASMAVSLEARAPLLDHRVVEFAWTLDKSHKIREGQGKWALRQVLYKYVPKELIERPKMGFGVPLDRWLRGPLREWAESLLAETKLRQQGLLDPAPIRQRWASHLNGENWAYPLWNVLMLQDWLQRNRAVSLN